MDNQHRKITGYRELSADEIAMVNAVKAQEAALLGLLGTVQAYLVQQSHAARMTGDASDELLAERARLAAAEPGRWAAIAKTHVQEGASALVRAITQPT